VTTEQRLIEIEIKLTRQEDLTQELSDLVYQQQKQINELQALCFAMARRMGDAASDGGTDPHVDERPPHY
jgi:SlyX protein